MSLLGNASRTTPGLKSRLPALRCAMSALDRIITDPARMNGQPCLRGLRLTVRRVVEIAALYPDSAERRREFPELEEEDISQALRYACRGASNEGSGSAMGAASL